MADCGGKWQSMAALHGRRWLVCRPKGGKNKSYNSMAATIPFQSSSNILVSGCSQSGKSEFTKQLILNAQHLFHTKPTICIFVYTHWQPSYGEIQQAMGDKVLFTEEIPTEDRLKEVMANHKHGLFIADDKASEIGTNSFFHDLLTRIAHHMRLTTVLIVQDAALSGKLRSSVLKNTHVNVLLRSPRERMYLRNLAIMMNDYKCIMAAFDDATSAPYGYLIIDTHPNASVDHKLRSRIFKHDGPCVIYQSKAKE